MTTETTAPVTAQEQPAGPPPAERAEGLMVALARLQSEAATLKAACAASPAIKALQAAQEAFEALPERAALQGNLAAQAAVADELRTTLDKVDGVFKTANGKVGYEIRRAITYTPESVRAIVPTLAAALISESVDGKALEAMVKAASKSKKVPEDALAQLQAAADVKTSRAWIFQPAAPVVPTAGASAAAVVPEASPAETAGTNAVDLSDIAEVRKAFFATVKGSLLDNAGARAVFLGHLTKGATTSLASFLETSSADDRQELLTEAACAVAANSPIPVGASPRPTGYDPECGF